MSSKSTVKERIEALGAELPGIVEAFGKLHDAATRDGALDRKTKRLVMVGIAVSQRCEACIRTHVGAAVQEGATRAEILEAAGAAILMGGGPAAATTATVVVDVLGELGV
ncbi:MAG: carboxymuconolactone decarboxylase family protein [Deferrisomatales bacterium]